MRRIAPWILLLAGCDREVPIGRNLFADALLPLDAGATPDATPPLAQRHLMLIDNSASSGAVDAMGAGRQAVVDLFDKYLGQPIYFGVVTFGSSANVVTTFFTDMTNNSDDLIRGNLSVGGGLSDFEGGLDAAKGLIETDARSLSDSELAKVHYTVVLITGSLPSPVCHGTPIACGRSVCAAGHDCRLGACVPEAVYCTLDRVNWQNLKPPPGPADFPSLQRGQDFNTVERIDEKVQAILALATLLQVGGVSLDAVLDFDLDATGDRAASAAFLQSLAEVSGGRFIDLSKEPLPY